MQKIRVLLSAIVVLVVLSAALGGFYLYTQYQPVNSASGRTVEFVVPQGQAIQVIGRRLHQAELVRQPWIFRLEVKRTGLGNKLQAGQFELSPSMSVTQIVQLMTRGTDDQWVTIPEGWRREEVAATLGSLDLPLFDEAEFLSLTADQEGKLFPDTYLVPDNISASQMADLLARTFEQKIIQGLAEEIAASEYSLEDALVMASLIERESRGADEMKEVAGVLWKRIEIGMPLQVDASLQYVKGYNLREKSWWSVPLAKDKELKSPYNTYLNAGLPPGPISSPGVDAIRAALDPAVNDYLFYIHDNSGQIRLARTLEEHNANVQRYLR